MALTGLQERFCGYYVAELNGYKAAKLAGYSGNDNQLRVIAHKNLSNPKVRAEIDKRLYKIIPSPNEILARLARHARGSIDDFLDEQSNIDMDKARRLGVTDLVKKYRKKTTHYENYSVDDAHIELYPQDAALDKMMKYYGLYRQDRSWHDEVIAGLRNGEISPADVREAFPTLAAEFFMMAGID